MSFKLVSFFTFISLNSLKEQDYFTIAQQL